MKLIFFILFFIVPTIQSIAQKKNIYDFKVQEITGETFNFASLKGKKILIVNTASECSLAGQMKKLQDLYEEYGGDDFEIIAFPSNDFGSHEPGSNAKIQQRYKGDYNISFPIMEKVKIKGENAHPVYQWLTSSEQNGTFDAKVIWNFQKFLIDEDGYVTDVVSPIGSPTKNRIIEWLQENH